MRHLRLLRNLIDGHRYVAGRRLIAGRHLDVAGRKLLSLLLLLGLLVGDGVLLELLELITGELEDFVHVRETRLPESERSVLSIEEHLVARDVHDSYRTVVLFGRLRR